MHADQTADSLSPAADADGRPPTWKTFLWPVLVSAICFAIFWPTLAWQQFQNSIECIAVGSSLEARRDHHWLMPTFNGFTRTRKPPLTTWLSAAAVRPETVAEMSDPSRSIREQAFEQFTREVRWPSLAATCLMLLVIFELGRVVGGTQVGFFAMLAAASNLLLLKYGRMATSDTQLSLWVAVANVCLARGLLLGQWRLGSIAGGIALGLAFLAKGPVALLETIAPAICFVLIWRQRSRATAKVIDAQPIESGYIAPNRLAVIVGIVMFLLVAVPWYLLMWLNVPDVWQTWLSEFTRINPADPRPDPWYQSFNLFWMMLPWVLWLVIGLAGSAVALWKCRSSKMGLVLVMLMIPLLVMALFPERKDRYRQPLIAPAAVLVGWAVQQHVQKWKQNDRRDLPVVVAHWLLVGGMTLGIPLAMAAGRMGPDRIQWISWKLAVPSIAALAILLAAGVYLHRRRPAVMVVVTCLAMFGMNTLHRLGERASGSSDSQLKPLADEIWARYPDAKVFSTGENRTQVHGDLVIYLNRIVNPRSDLSDLRPGNIPQVVVVYQESKEPKPKPPTIAADSHAFWSELPPIARGRNWYYCFVLQPIRPAAP